MVVLERTLLTQVFALLTYFSGATGRAVDTRSQAKNKQLAFKRMAESKRFKDWQRIEIARRLGRYAEEECLLKEIERIKTYSFKENRVNDHRTGKTSYDLDSYLNGKKL